MFSSIVDRTGAAALIETEQIVVSEIKVAVHIFAMHSNSEMLNSESEERLKIFALEYTSQYPPKQAKLIAALLLALCQEPGLLAALQDEARRPAW